MVKDISLSQNYLLTFVLINFTILRRSASNRNCWIPAKCTWRILGMPCAFPVCQHMEWGCRNNGSFHLLDSSAAQNIPPPPLPWHWYHISSFQKKSQLDGKRRKLDLQHGYSMSHAAKHCSVIKTGPLSLLQSCFPFLNPSFTQTLPSGSLDKKLSHLQTQQKETFPVQSFKWSQ